MEEGRLDTVDSHLNAKGNVFAIGDCAWIEIDGKLATKTCLEAEQQAKYLASHFRDLGFWGRLSRSIRCGPAQIARWRSFPWARTSAVGVVGKTCIGVPTRLIYSLKSWINESFIKQIKTPGSYLQGKQKIG